MTSEFQPEQLPPEAAAEQPLPTKESVEPTHSLDNTPGISPAFLRGVRSGQASSSPLENAVPLSELKSTSETPGDTPAPADYTMLPVDKWLESIYRLGGTPVPPSKEERLAEMVKTAVEAPAVTAGDLISNVPTKEDIIKPAMTAEQVDEVYTAARTARSKLDKALEDYNNLNDITTPSARRVGVVVNEVILSPDATENPIDPSEKAAAYQGRYVQREDNGAIVPQFEVSRFAVQPREQTLPEGIAAESLQGCFARNRPPGHQILH
jgi:hypothetical protein